MQDDPRKVGDLIAPFTNDQCVIQTLHSPHDTSQLQLASQQNQNQSQPTHHSQHQNVRDMDIIHVSIPEIEFSIVYNYFETKILVRSLFLYALLQ